MGRAASHITLECALQTHPNITIIGEEVSFELYALQYPVLLFAGYDTLHTKAHLVYFLVV